MFVARSSDRSRALVFCAGLVLLASAASVGLAHAQGDDRAAAEALAQPVEDAGPMAVTAEALARTREALEEATRFRAAGDEAHAKAADGLAREWAETARDLALAAAAEKQAGDRKRQAIQAQVQLERTRALVDDGVARLGRVRAELGEAPAGSTTAVEVHDGQGKPAPTGRGRASASPPKAHASDSTHRSTP
jgi:hypothetical protein